MEERVGEVAGITRFYVREEVGVLCELICDN